MLDSKAWWQSIQIPKSLELKADVWMTYYTDGCHNLINDKQNVWMSFSKEVYFLKQIEELMCGAHWM